MGKLTAPEKAAQAGRARAEADIAAGQLQYVYCFPRGPYSCYNNWVLDLFRLKKERLGVESDVYLECPWKGVQSRKAFAAAYNERVTEEIARRFGPDAEANVRREVCGF